MQFRVSKALAKCGVTPEEQGLIFYFCLNAKKLDANIQNKILNTCKDVAADDYQALYRFLTDARVNHVYICDTYFISKARLFKLKRKFYLKFKI